MSDLLSPRSGVARAAILAGLFLGVVILPLLVVTVGWNQLLSGLNLPTPPIDQSSPGSRTFSIEAYMPPEGPKLARVEGTAPPLAEVAVYLDDDLITITNADLAGRFSADLPTPRLYGRVGKITVLPAEIDASTLKLLYTQRGFDWANTVPPLRSPTPAAPTIALPVEVTDSEIVVRGSTEPRTEVEITLDGSAHGTGESDGEGSFEIALPLTGSEPGEQRELVARARYSNADDWTAPSPPVTFSAAAAQPGDPAAVFVRIVRVYLSSTDIRLTFEVEMPTSYTVYQNLARGNIGVQAFLDYVFGPVASSTFPDPHSLSWQETLQPGADRVTVAVNVGPLPYLIPEDAVTTLRFYAPDSGTQVPPSTGHDTLELILLDEGFRLSDRNVPPTCSEAGHVIWEGPLVDKTSFLLEISRNPILEPHNWIRTQQEFEAVYSALPGITVDPLMQTSLENNLTTLIPADLPAAAKAQVYDFFRELYLEDPLLPFDDEEATARTFLRDLPGRAPADLEALLTAAMWLLPPVLVLWALWRRPQRGGATPDKWPLMLTAWGTLTLVVLTFDLSSDLFHSLLDMSHKQYLAFLVSAHIMFLVLYWPSRTPAGTWWVRLPGRPVVSLVLSLLLYAALLLLAVGLPAGLMVALPFVPDPLLTGLMAALPLLGLASLLWREWLDARASSRAGSDSKRRTVRRSLAIGILVVAVLALSVPIQKLGMFAQSHGTTGVSTLALTAIRPVLSLALMAGVVSYWRASNTTTVISPRKLDWAIALAFFLSFVVGLRPSWGYMPVSLVSGLLAYTYWLMDTSRVSRNLAALAKLLKNARRELIAHTLQLKAEERSRRERIWTTIRTVIQDVRAGREITPTSAQPEEAPAAEKEATEPPSTAYLDSAKLMPGIGPQDIAFNYGLGRNRWDDVRQTLRLALLYIVPMLAIYAVITLTDSLDEAAPFPILGVLIRLSALGAQLLASALFLAYFFPEIRGRTGLAKSLWLSLAVIVAFLPVYALTVNDLAGLAGVVLWTANLLFFNLYIGLVAFDLRNLTTHGFDWRRLSDLHNIPSFLLGYLPKVAPVLLPIITTLVQERFGGAAADLLNTLIPPLVSGEGMQSALLEVMTTIAEQMKGGV
jgi:hypothetical protein